MRNVKIALIAVLCIIMLGLCVLLGFSMSGRGFWNRQGGGFSSDYQQVMEVEVPLEGLHTIDINYGKNSNDVRIYEGDGDKVVIKEYANYDVPDSEATSAGVNDGTLEIKGKRRNFLSFHFFSVGNGSGYTEVYLPKAYGGNLYICTASGDVQTYFDLQLEGDLGITVASGDMTMENASAQKAFFTSASGDIRSGELEAEEASITTASGEVSLEKLKAEEASITTASGEVSLEELEAEEAGINTASGDVRLQRLEAADITISTASGEVRIQEVNGRLDCTTASGDVYVDGGSGYGEIGTASGEVKMFFAELTGDLSVNTASGDVTLALPEDSSFTFEADTASGDIDTFFDDVLRFSKKGNQAGGVVNEDTAGRKVEIETTSGDIRILQN